MAYVVKVVETQAADAETTVGDAFAVSWDDRLNDVGFGTVSMPSDDTAAGKARVPLNEVRIYEADGTTLRWAFVIQQIDTTVVGPAEGGSKTLTVSGEGMGSRLSRAIVYPEYGLERPFGQTRLFGLMTPDMNGINEGASLAVSYGRQDNPDAEISDALTGFPLDWPDPGAEWLTARALEDIGAGVLRHPATSDSDGWGVFYLRREFTTATDLGRCRLFAALDSYGTVWWDGVPVIETADPTNYLNGLSADIEVGEGAHTIAVRVVNRGPALNLSADNYALALLSILQLDDDGLNTNDVVYRTFGSGLVAWQAFDTLDLGDTVSTLADPPGLNAGIIMNLLIAESAARTVGTVDAIDYDDALSDNGDEASETDTAGDTWTETVNNFGWQIGTDYLTVLQGLQNLCGVDWYVSPDRTLSMWQNGRGVDRGGTPDVGASSVTLALADDLESYRVEIDAPIANRYLVRSGQQVSEQGDSDSQATFGLLEELLDLGTVKGGSAEAGAAVSRALAGTASPVYVASGSIHGDSGAAPYVDFNVGDTVVATDDSGSSVDFRVTSITVTQEDANGLPLYDVELEKLAGA